MSEALVDPVTLPTAHGLPLAYCWSGQTNPLPLRSVRLPQHHRRHHPFGLEAPPWFNTGRVEQPFDFSGHVSRLCIDIARRCPELQHVDASRLIFGMTQARTGRRHGLQARVTPLRFRKGKLTRQRHGVCYQVQRYFVDEREILYLMTFCLPRFLDQDFDDKFITLFHEMYHVGPAFDGDLRRHPGRCAMHTSSKNSYDKHMAHLVRQYLAAGADASLHGFLRLNFSQLQHRHGSVVGVAVPRPKLIPLDGAP